MRDRNVVYAAIGFVVFLLVVAIAVLAFNAFDKDEEHRADVLDTTIIEERETGMTESDSVDLEADTVNIDTETPKVVREKVIEKHIIRENNNNNQSTIASPERQVSKTTSQKPESSISVRQQEVLNYGGPDISTKRKFDSRQEWNAFWQAETQHEAPVSFDPNRETAVVIFLGQRNTGGYSVKIDSITERNGQVIVNYQVMEPAPGQPVTQALTTPGIVVTIPKTDKEIIFQERDI
jgi:hypothetical protein